MIKCKFKFILTFILLFISLVSITNSSLAYYGDGNCSHSHGIKYIDIPIDNNADIILDGIPSEPFWADPANKNGSITIKLSEMRVGLEIPEIYTLNATFIMNEEYLYILCVWNDKTPLYDYPPEKDGIAFCWNIDTPNFTAYYIADMNTRDMGNGSVDAWRWTYDDDLTPGEIHHCGDDCFNEDGWIDGNPEANSIDAAFTNTTSSYSLELRRKLNTNEVYDVQFTEKKVYKFNVAILNDSHYEDHAISWTYALDLREEPRIISGFPIGYLLLFSCLFGLGSLLKNNRKIKICYE
jgi:hypothetical protein